MPEEPKDTPTSPTGNPFPPGTPGNPNPPTQADKPRRQPFGPLKTRPLPKDADKNIEDLRYKGVL